MRKISILVLGAAVLYRDQGTGCEYLTTGRAEALTPRMGADGKQICREKP